MWRSLTGNGRTIALGTVLIFAFLIGSVEGGELRPYELPSR